MAPHRPGWGLSTEVSFAVPPASLVYWSGRLERYGVEVRGAEVRFGQQVLAFTDTHGLPLALVESHASLQRGFTPWEASPIPVEHQIRGLESARMLERDLVVTTDFLAGGMGFREVGTENGWHRYAVGEGSSGFRSITKASGINTAQGIIMSFNCPCFFAIPQSPHLFRFLSNF